MEDPFTMSNKKQSKSLLRKESKVMDEQSVKLFGKHVTKEKAGILLAATLLACAAPMILGVRMWNQIPEIVPSGLIGTNGQDDSIPRWMVALGLPALMCTLNCLSHYQLRRHQKKKMMPPAHVRLMGRWGFPILSVIFCSGMIRQSIGVKPLDIGFHAPCVLGLLLMLLGTHMFDCPRDSRIALRFPFTENSDKSWKEVHRFAGRCWLTVGLLVIIGAMLMERFSPIMAVVVLVSLVAPILYGRAKFAGNK